MAVVTVVATAVAVQVVQAAQVDAIHANHVTAQGGIHGAMALDGMARRVVPRVMEQGNVAFVTAEDGSISTAITY